MLQADEIGVEPSRLGERADLCAVFGRRAPVELEIGCGKGGFLLRRAMACPERNFLGIEWASKYYRFAVDRMQRRGIENVRLLRTDGGQFVRERLPPACLAALHIYHPDPWPKKRHHKRRLINAAFVDAAAAALEPGGRLAIQTDHGEYFEVIRGLTAAHPLLEAAPFEDAEFGTVGESVETNYEIKYVRQGRRFFRLAFWRRGAG